MALYVAICLLAAFAALPETGAHAHAMGIIWGVTIGLAVAHWFAFRVSARLVGAGSIRPNDMASAGAQLAGAAGVALLGGMVKFCGSPVLHDHAATSWVFSSGASLGRSTSFPFSNLAPARTRATRCGPLTARQRS
jgi:hypothetical protein